MNAFHPEYMKTHYPNFWTEQVASSRSVQAMNAAVRNKKRGVNQNTINVGRKVISLKPLDFLVFAKAGVPK